MADTDVSKYGTVMTPEQTRDWMRQQYKGYETQMNKLYQSLYSGANLAAQGQLEDLQYDYAKAMGQAYSQSRQQEQSIWGSNIGKGYKEQYMAETSDALRGAYDQYRAKYLASRDSVEEQRQSNVESIWKSQVSQEQAMKDYAANLSKMYNYGQKYLDYLYKNNEDLFQSPEWSRWLKETTDEQGQTTQGLYQSANEFNKLLTTIENGDTVLSETGREFFDQILNYDFAGVDAKSYAEWLSETDPELFEWSIGTTGIGDASLDVTGMPTNIQQFREMVGAGDQWFNYGERKMVNLDNVIDDAIASADKLIKQKGATWTIFGKRIGGNETAETRRTNAVETLFEAEKELEKYGYSPLEDKELQKAKQDLYTAMLIYNKGKDKIYLDELKEAYKDFPQFGKMKDVYIGQATVDALNKIKDRGSNYEQAYNKYIELLKKYKKS